jgi:hypothetical protein
MLRRQMVRAYVPLLPAFILAGACSSPENTSPRQAPPPLQSSRPQPPPPQTQGFVVAPDLPPLPPFAVANSGYPPDVVRAVHMFAAQHPDVLRYMPCFCGCQRGGHKGNDDCFVAGRDSAGKVKAWDTHGVT